MKLIREADPERICSVHYTEAVIQIGDKVALCRQCCNAIKDYELSARWTIEEVYGPYPYGVMDANKWGIARLCFTEKEVAEQVADFLNKLEEEKGKP